MTVYHTGRTSDTTRPNSAIYHTGRTSDTTRPNSAIDGYLDPSGLSPVAVFPLWEMDEQSPRDSIADGGDPSTIGLRQLTVNGGPIDCGTNGQFGEALDFDGSTQYLTHAAHADFQQTGALTVGAWVHAKNLSNAMAIASCAGDADATEAKNNLWTLSLETDGSIKLAWEEGAGVDYSRSSSAGAVSAATTTMVFATRSATGEVTFYTGTNSAAAAATDSTSATTTMPSGGASSTFAIAAFARDNSMKFYGQINGVWIAASELSSSNITTLYNASVRESCAVLL